MFQKHIPTPRTATASHRTFALRPPSRQNSPPRTPNSQPSLPWSHTPTAARILSSHRASSPLSQHPQNPSSPCTPRGGARMGRCQGNPRCRSTRDIDSESNTMLSTLRRPPQGHSSTSSRNTRLISSAHTMRTMRVLPTLFCLCLPSKSGFCDAIHPLCSDRIPSPCPGTISLRPVDLSSACSRRV